MKFQKCHNAGAIVRVSYMDLKKADFCQRKPVCSSNSYETFNDADKPSTETSPSRIIEVLYADQDCSGYVALCRTKFEPLSEERTVCGVTPNPSQQDGQRREPKILPDSK